MKAGELSASRKRGALTRKGKCNGPLVMVHLLQELCCSVFTVNGGSSTYIAAEFLANKLQSIFYFLQDDVIQFLISLRACIYLHVSLQNFITLSCYAVKLLI